MTNEKIQELKKRLEEGKKELSEKIRHATEDIQDFGSDVDHGEEEADESEAHANQLAGVLPMKERLDDVEHALRKIEGGTYGKCEKCGMEIEEEILEIDPESRLCKNCKMAA